jgi:cell division protein FtsW
MKKVLFTTLNENNLPPNRAEIEKRQKALKSDRMLLIVLFILLILGTIMIASASYPYANSHYNDGSYYIKRQIVFLAIGIATMIFTSNISIRFYKKISPYFYLICSVLLVVVLFGGFSEGVAKRWLGIPGTPLSFQPSELMKLGIILALSWYISEKIFKKSNLLTEIILPGGILFGACGLVLLEKHLSGTVIIALIGISVLFIGGINAKKMALVYGVTALAGGIVFLLTNSYAMKRIESFLNPNADVLSDKWQTTQGLFAIGSGGFFGLGLGNSRQKYSYVSEPQNDFIFTIWCEEMGFVGAVLLIILFLLLIWRGYSIAMRSPDTFSSLVAFGITSQIGIQSFLNMLVVTDLIPNTGISLPFFSYGGSLLVILLAEMGILLSISKISKLKGK